MATVLLDDDSSDDELQCFVHFSPREYVTQHYPDEQSPEKKKQR